MTATEFKEQNPHLAHLEGDELWDAMEMASKHVSNDEFWEGCRKEMEAADLERSKNPNKGLMFFVPTDAVTTGRITLNYTPAENNDHD